jgi:protein-S-isoprenylcysteine O-methyltransferase Ste14
MSSEPAKSKPRIVPRLGQTAGFIALWLVVLFGAAGRLDWTRGWIYVATYLVGMGGAGLVIRRRNPGLFEARASFRRKDTKRFDKVFMIIYLPLVLLQPAIAGVDAVRFHWSSLPFAFVYAGVVLFAIASAFIAWVMAVNRFAETTVRIQTERGHVVVSAGPYCFVRHPMYVGMILMFLGGPMIMGSVWALAEGGVIGALTIWRTAMEDRTLRRELEGYQEFTTHTPYRLVPGVW